MTSAAGQDREIEQLKTLLFQTEAGRLDTLESDVAALRQYVGAAERLEVATADILVAALARAEVSRPRELANTIAPSVVSAIRSEITNSRALMIDALYPITGRLVSAAVGNAFKELLAFLEERLNSLTSTELWIGRVKSLVTGRPLSEFLLGDSKPLQVDRLLIIERGSGRLIADWKREGAPDERADLLSGMVAAILEFSVQALVEEGSLRRLDFGGKELVLRDSPRFILAAKCAGALRPADDARINTLFFDTIEAINRGEICNVAMLEPLAAAIANVQDAPRRKGSGRIVLSALALLAAGGLTWLTVRTVNRAMLERRAQAVLEEQVTRQPRLASFPLRLDFDHGDRIFEVSGIAPADVELPSVVEALATVASGYELVERVGVVPTTDETAALRAEAAGTGRIAAEMQGSLEDIRTEIVQASQAGERRYLDLVQRYAALGEQYAELRNRYDELNERLARLQSTVDGPAERLDRFMASTAIFFAESDTFLQPEDAARRIAELAELLKGNARRIRVVGHADEAGSPSSNEEFARWRAERVAEVLAEAGVEPARLVIVSRATSVPIAEGTGRSGNTNRRVTFEHVFRNEPEP